MSEFIKASLLTEDEIVPHRYDIIYLIEDDDPDAVYDDLAIA